MNSSSNLLLIALAAVGALATVRLLLPAGTPQFRRGKKAATAGSIAALQKLRIGDSDQWILYRSEDISNPVILFLHGGPGTSELTLNRQNTKDLEPFFTVVSWDQRGAGKSYAAIKDAARMNIDQFVEDTREVTLYLLKKFRKKNIVLVGHSWGSVVGALTVAKYPELYACYVGIGQVANMKEGEAASYQWTLAQARKANDRKAIRTLEKTGPPPYSGNWHAKFITQRRLSGRFGGEMYGSMTGAFGLVIGSLLFSRE